MNLSDLVLPPMGLTGSHAPECYLKHTGEPQLPSPVTLPCHLLTCDPPLGDPDTLLSSSVRGQQWGGG